LVEKPARGFMITGLMATPSQQDKQGLASSVMGLFFRRYIMEDITIIIGNKKYSSWSLRGWLAIKLSGLPFDEVKLPIDTPEFYEAIKRYTPTNCVPVLHHGENIIWDSLAIIDYIAHLCPELKLWPDDRAQYAHAKSICSEMHSGFMSIRGAVPMNIGSSYSNLGLSEGVAKDVKRIDQIWTECRKKFGFGGDFLFGNISAADLMYAPVVHRFNSYNLPRSDISQEYMDAMLNHPAMKEWAAEAAKETLVVAADEIDPETTILGA